MKIAISSMDSGVDSRLDERLGRCSYFACYNTESTSWEVIDNTSNQNLSGGAGIQAAELLHSNCVDVVITGHCGPKAFRALDATGIKLFQCETMTVKEALTKYENNELKRLYSSDQPGHW